MDWESEVSSLNTGTEFLKLGAGQHKVTFLDEGIAKTVEYEGKEYDKIFFRVKKEDVEFTWTVAKGITLNSLYGQIALIGKHMGGMTGKTVTVLVKGEGKNKDYTIMEAVGLQQQEANLKKVETEKVE